MVAGILREGGRFGAVRLRTHDEDSAVLTGIDLVPTLCQVLSLTFEPSVDGASVGRGLDDGPLYNSPLDDGPVRDGMCDNKEKRP